ncbi:MAG: glycosyl hydrolase [Rikenellaceae bacterium]
MRNQFTQLLMATVAIAAVCCGGCNSDTGTDNSITTDPETLDVVSVSLEEGSIVEVDFAKIDLRYSVPISIAQSDKIVLSSANGDKIELNAVANNLTLSVSLLDNLAYDKQYTLTLEAGAVEAKSSGAPSTRYSLSFASEEEPFVVDPSADFTIDESLINPSATSEAVALYDYLREGFGVRTLSGAMCKYTVQSTEAEWMVEKSGRYPAILCYDFMNVTREWSWDEPYSTMITSAEEWAKSGGVVAAMWHWRDPLRTTDAFYSMNTSNSERTSFDVSKVHDTSSAEYEAMVADIDVVATYLKELQDLGIAVLWRPLHEAQGAWFWWGAGSADDCKALWGLLYDRLTNHHGLNNLIWVWTVDKKDGANDWYPGGDMVDILGTDIYGTPTHDSRREYFDFVATIGYHNKLVTLSECGAIPSPENMVEGGDTWSWFMPWVGDFTQSDSYNGAEYLNTILNSDFVITRDEVEIY